MTNREILADQQPGTWGILKSGTLTTLNEIGAGLLDVLNFGTEIGGNWEKPSWEKAPGVFLREGFRAVGIALPIASGGLKLQSALAARVGSATAEAVEAEELVGCKSGSASFGQFTEDQSALVDLAKGAKRTGVTPDEARILREWADEYGLPSRGPETHLNRNFDVEHIHIGPIDHIPVR